MPYIEHDFPIEGLNKIAQKEGNAKKPIYQMHKWWARRLGSVFRMLILAAFAEDDVHPTELWRRFYTRNQLTVERDGKRVPPIILDPFMGGGTTVVEALRLGCKVIGVDLNPVAWFVTKKEIEPVDLDALDMAFKHLEKTVAPKILHYYRTTCPLGHPADVMYVFWVKKVACLGCGQDVRLFPSFHLASKGDNHTVFCSSCYHIFQTNSLQDEVRCQECGHAFAPAGGYSDGGYYICPACGQRERVLDAVQRREGPPAMEMFAIEYYCPTCEREGYDRRGYKPADAEDLTLFAEARTEFERRKDELPFPRQKIPTEGRSDPRPVNYGYEYWHQMFNARQLLCLGMLLDAILRISDTNIRELLVMTLSDAVNANNLFCKYNAPAQKLEPLFGLHAFHPVDQPIENNVWGTEYGRGSFVKYFDKTRKGKEYGIRPFERDGAVRRKTGDTVAAELAEDFASVLAGQANGLLWAQTSEDLYSIPDHSVDAVITDPPYCDNVAYAELADFFYVWLRLGLNDAYPWFAAELSPKAREIVQNEAQDKDEEFFFQGLTRVFRECHRVLNDDGLMTFTFHHKDTWAWKSVLSAILDAGFYVVAVYPVQSEGRTGFHSNVGNIRYDIPFVCRKRSGDGQVVSWEALKDKIYFAAQESVERIKTSGRSISDADLFVVVMGRCLELYSKHWPNVLKEGQRVDVDRAVDDLDGLVDSLIKSYELKLLPASLDDTTKLYLLYIAGQKTVSADELRKRLVTGGGSLDLFTKREYLLTRHKQMAVATPDQRMAFIEREKERGGDLPLIDVAHYLYATYKAGQPVQWFLGRWTRDELVAVLEHLYRKSGDRTWRSLAELTRSALAAATKPLL
jgi:adenine-specific DNA methylase